MTSLRTQTIDGLLDEVTRQECRFAFERRPGTDVACVERFAALRTTLDTWEDWASSPAHASGTYLTDCAVFVDAFGTRWDVSGRLPQLER